MSEEKITDILARIEEKINMVEKKLEQFHPDTSEAQATIEYAHSGKYHDCYQKNIGKFTHLNHTENPQLNNITDMLQYIISECRCKDKTNQNIEDTKEKIHNLIIDIENKQKQKESKPDQLRIIINQLEDIKKKQKICLTQEELDELIRKNSSFPRGEEETQEQLKQLTFPKLKQLTVPKTDELPERYRLKLTSPRTI